MATVPNTAQGILTAAYGGYQNVKKLTGRTSQMAFVNPVTNTDLICFDAVMNEAHARESSPTVFPLEDGSNITDHIVVAPFELSIQGMVSDTPFGLQPNIDTTTASGLSALASPLQIAGGAVGVSGLFPPLGIAAVGIGLGLYDQKAAGVSRSNRAYGLLLALQAGNPDASPPIPPAIFNVRTKLRMYTSMCLRSLSVQRDNATGNAIMFQASLTQIRVVKSQSVNVRVLLNKPRAAPKANEGEKTPKKSAQQLATEQGIVDGRSPVKTTANSFGLVY